MANIKLQIFSESSLLNEFDIEDNRTYKIGSGIGCTIPIFDENFPGQLITFKKIGDFISIEEKGENTKLPPTLKIPTSFTYKGYKFLFKKTSQKIIAKTDKISKVIKTQDKKKKLITIMTVIIIVISIIGISSYLYINERKFKQEFDKDLGELTQNKSEEVLNKSVNLLRKYKKTKYEYILQKKIDEIMQIKNKYTSLIENLRFISIHRADHKKLSELLRERKKILAKIEWPTYRKEAEKLLNKIELKIIFRKHKAYLNILTEFMEQINDGRFVQAYSHYNKVLTKNSMILPRYKNIIKKKLDIALEKDKKQFEKELLALINDKKFDDAENLIITKKISYPPNHTPKLNGYLNRITAIKKEIERIKSEENKQEEPEEPPQDNSNDIKENEEPIKQKPTKEEPQFLKGKDLLEIIKQKGFEKLPEIFSGDKYRFENSEDFTPYYYFAKSFINMEENCKKKKPFEYTINKTKKIVSACDTKTVTFKDKKIVDFKSLEWQEIYYIMLNVEDDFDNKINILKFAGDMGLEKNIGEFLGFLYVTEKDKQDQIKQLVKKYIIELQDKNPIWRDGKWISDEILICEEIGKIVKNREGYNKIIKYLSNINEKTTNFAGIKDCKNELAQFVDYTLEVLKTQYTTTIDNLFDLTNKEIDELRKNVVNIIRSDNYLASVQKKGEQVEWDPSGGKQSEFQEFLDNADKYIDTVLENPWESKTMKDKFKDIDKLMIIYKFFENVDKENLLADFLKKWDNFWKPKWTKLVDKRFQELKRIEEQNDKVYAILKKQNRIKNDEIECMKKVNKYRVKLGFNALKFNEKLHKGAQIHAAYLEKLAEIQKKNNQELRLSHFEPKGSPTERPEDRAKKAGYKPNKLSENIAYSPSDDKNTPYWIVEGWRHSPYHHNGLITQDVIEVGCYKEKYAWVILFGSEK